VLGLLLRATRAPSLLAGAMPAVVLPALVASQGGAVRLLPAAVTAIGLIALQAGVNVVNDLFDDESGLDADPEFARSPFPLGSRVLQSGALSRRGMWSLAAGCFGLGLVCGLYLDTLHPGHTVLWIGVAGAVLGYFYTAPPLKLAYLGVGEPIIFLLFGPMAGLGATFVQTGRLDDGPALLVSSALGVLIMAVLYLHHFPQHDADARHGKKTPIVRLGQVRAGRLVPVMMAAPFAMIAAGVATGALPPAALAFGLGVVPAINASRLALVAPTDGRRMTQAFGHVMLTLLVGSLSLAIALSIGSRSGSGDGA